MINLDKHWEILSPVKSFLLHNINQSDSGVLLHPFDNCLSQLVSRRLIYCPLLGAAGLTQAGFNLIWLIYPI